MAYERSIVGFFANQVLRHPRVILRARCHAGPRDAGMRVAGGPMCKRTSAFFLLVMASGCSAQSRELDTAGASQESLATEDSPFDQKLINPLATSHHVESNRAYDLEAGSRYWTVSPGAHVLDGLGHARGEIRYVDRVQINYGQRKSLGGESLLYTFATELTDGTVAGGWVFESAFVEDTSVIPTINARDPGDGDLGAEAVVSGGDPARWSNLKITPNYDGPNQAPTDYLLRDGGYVNLCYNLPGNGGVSTDTFPVGVHFQRARGVSPVSKPVFSPGTSDVVGHMVFVYGRIGDRFGWLAEAALD